MAAPRRSAAPSPGKPSKPMDPTGAARPRLIGRTLTLGCCAGQRDALELRPRPAPCLGRVDSFELADGRDGGRAGVPGVPCPPATTSASSSAPPRDTTAPSTRAADHQREDQAARHGRARRIPRASHIAPPSRPVRLPPIRSRTRRRRARRDHRQPGGGPVFATRGGSILDDEARPEPRRPARPQPPRRPLGYEVVNGPVCVRQPPYEAARAVSPMRDASGGASAAPPAPRKTATAAGVGRIYPMALDGIWALRHRAGP